MIIRYSDGSFVNGVIHSIEGSTIRAAVAGFDDAVEFTLIADDWISAGGAPVTFEFLLKEQVDPFAVLFDRSDPTPAACAAGGHCLLRRISPADTRPPN
jgi:hypothetical protein